MTTQGIATSRSLPRRSTQRVASIEPTLLGAVGALVFVGLWHAASVSGAINPLLLASPAQTAVAFAELFLSGEIWPHLNSSLLLLGVGFGVAVISGTALGILAGWFTDLRSMMAPHVAVLYATPVVALMPLFIIWFGLGFASQLAVVVMLAFFPPFYAGLDAVRMTDPGLVRVARGFGASQGRIFWTIVLPASVPHVLSGSRIALGKAIVGMTVVELYASTSGLGYLLIAFGNAFKTAEVFSVLLVIALIGVGAQLIFYALEKRFDSWRTV